MLAAAPPLPKIQGCLCVPLAAGVGLSPVWTARRATQILDREGAGVDGLVSPDLRSCPRESMSVVSSKQSSCFLEDGLVVCV